MYIIIDVEYKIYQVEVLTRYIRAQCGRGNFSVVDISSMKGMNLVENQEELGEWSDIQEFFPSTCNLTDADNEWNKAALKIEE